MFRPVALLLPALIPSWRFFATVKPSPRIEFALLSAVDEEPRHWREFDPRPAHVPLYVMLGRLFWNPRWNRTLFLLSCVERFLDSGSEQALTKILSCLRSELRRPGAEQSAARYFRMRLVVLSRIERRVVREEVYRSAVQSLATEHAP